MILMIDNYDSFTYNLVQYLMMLGEEVKVVRNDKVSLEEVEQWQPDGIVISPGPGRPDEAGLSIPIINKFSGKIPILGVCLGHQAIVRAFGGEIIKAKQIMHGKTSMISHNDSSVFKGLPDPMEAMRYHSLVANRENFPDCLEITAESEDGEIMGICHKDHNTAGIQFHPESIMTRVGKRLLRNFVRNAAK